MGLGVAEPPAPLCARGEPSATSGHHGPPAKRQQPQRTTADLRGLPRSPIAASCAATDVHGRQWTTLNQFSRPPQQRDGALDLVVTQSTEAPLSDLPGAVAYAVQTRCGNHCVGAGTGGGHDGLAPADLGLGPGDVRLAPLAVVRIVTLVGGPRRGGQNQNDRGLTRNSTQEALRGEASNVVFGLVSHADGAGCGGARAAERRYRLWLSGPRRHRRRPDIETRVGAVGV